MTMKQVYYLNLLFVLLLLSFSRNGICAEPPYLAPIPDQTALVGQPFTLDIDAINANPAETYALTEARPGMTIDATTGVISWTPADIADGGTVTVRAYNSAGESVEEFQYLPVHRHTVSAHPSFLLEAGFPSGRYRIHRLFGRL